MHADSALGARAEILLSRYRTLISRIITSNNDSIAERVSVDGDLCLNASPDFDHQAVFEALDSGPSDQPFKGGGRLDGEGQNAGAASNSGFCALSPFIPGGSLFVTGLGRGGTTLMARLAAFLPGYCLTYNNKGNYEDYISTQIIHMCSLDTDLLGQIVGEKDVRHGSRWVLKIPNLLQILQGNNDFWRMIAGRNIVVVTRDFSACMSSESVSNPGADLGDYMGHYQRFVSSMAWICGEDRPAEIGLAFVSYEKLMTRRAPCVQGFWDWFARDVREEDRIGFASAFGSFVDNANSVSEVKDFNRYRG
jgi:hypothetical protein